MPTPVRIAAAGVTVAATLSDSPTAARIAAATVLAAVCHCFQQCLLARKRACC